MKYLFSITFFFILFQSFSQEKNIEKINFKYSHSSVVFTSFNIKIKINNKKERVKLIYTKYEFRNKIKKKFNVPYEDFLKLKQALFKINLDDFKDEKRLCMDASTFYIDFIEKDSNNFKKQINYGFYCLGETDSNTNLSDFLKAVNLILEFSNLEFKDLE